MNWYRVPYFGQTAEKRKYKIMQKLDAGEYPLFIYLIVLASDVGESDGDRITGRV